LLCDLACKEVSLLQRGRRDKLLSSRLGSEQASLFSFGVGKVGDDGRVAIRESHSKLEREQGEDSAEEAGKPKRRSGRPVKDKTATHPEATQPATHPFSKSDFFFKSISTQDSKIHQRLDKKHSGPSLASPKQFEPRSINITPHILIKICGPIIRLVFSDLGQHYKRPNIKRRHGE
jgi:hypothetical protein